MGGHMPPVPPPQVPTPMTCTGGAQPLVARARAPVCPSLATPLTMLNVRSWIVHLTPIPFSPFHFCPNLARLPHYV